MILMTHDQQIIADFGALMERSPPLPTRIEDVSALPHLKEAILTALVRALLSKRYTEEMEEYLKIALLSVPQYQKGVGEKPIEMLGDIDKFSFLVFSNRWFNVLDYEFPALSNLRILHDSLDLDPKG